DPIAFDWRFQPPRATWSLLRGASDDTNLFLSLAIWIGTTCWGLGTSVPRLVFFRRNPPPADPNGGVLLLWTCSFVWYAASVWSRMLTAEQITDLAWIVPAVACSLSGIFLIVEGILRLRDTTYPLSWLALPFALLCSLGALTIGIFLEQAEEID